MAILEQGREPPAQVHCTAELRVETPYERRELTREFYAGVLRLPAWPAACQIPGGWGAGDPRRGVYFEYRHDARVEPFRARLVLRVPSLDTAAQRLRDANCRFARRSGWGVTDSCIVAVDPAGHRVEIRPTRRL